MNSLPVIVIPKQYVAIKPTDILLFLAGPVRGGKDWQHQCIKAFIEGATFFWTDTLREKVFGRLKIIVPCRWGKEHHLAAHFATTYEEVTSGSDYQVSQTAMERFYLSAAINQGNGSRIVFGLFEEDEENPRPKDEGPYAQDTYGEIGRWSVVANYTDSPCVRIGYQANFPRVKTIKRNLLNDWRSSWHHHVFEVDDASALGCRIALDMEREVSRF